jgi:hypothetical protein
LVNSYLFATSCTTQLTPKHNGGEPLSDHMKWADFFEWRFLEDNSNAIVEYSNHGVCRDATARWSPFFNLSKVLKDSSYLRVASHLSSKDQMQYGQSPEHFVGQFELLENFVQSQMQQGNFSQGFIWEIYPVYYGWRVALTNYFKAKHLSIRGFGGDCSYVKDTKSQISKEIASLVIQAIHRQAHYPIHLLGRLHIRRGDTKSVCDTVT